MCAITRRAVWCGVAVIAVACSVNTGSLAAILHRAVSRDPAQVNFAAAASTWLVALTTGVTLSARVALLAVTLACLV